MSTSLLHLADLVRGVTYKREEASREPVTGMLPIIRANNIQDGQLALDDLIYVPASRVSREQRLRRGDIVFAMSSGSPDVVGKAALLSEDWHGAFGAFCGVLRARPGTLSEWLAYFLQSPMYRDAVRSVITGTNINNLNRSALDAVKVPTVPLAAQRDAVVFLDAFSQSQRSARAHLVAARYAIERLRRAVLYAATSGRLTEDWRRTRNSSPAGLLDRLVKQQSGRKHPVITPEPTWLPEVPDSWSRVTLSSLVKDIEAGKSFKALPRPARPEEWGVVKVSAMSWGRFLEDENKALLLNQRPNAAHEIHEGDLLISRANTVDLVGATVLVGRCRGHLLLSDKSLRLVPMPGVDKAWLNYVLASPAVRSQFANRATGTSDSMRNLSQPKILATTLAVPSTDEQLEIARRVSDLLEVVDQLLVRVRTASQRIDRSPGAVIARTMIEGSSRMEG